MCSGFLSDCQLHLEHASVLCQLRSCTHKNKTKHLTMECVVNMGFYQLLHNRHPKLAEKVKPNLKKCPQTFSVWLLWLFKTSARQLSKPIALWQALNEIDQNGRHHAEESVDGWHSPTIVKRPVNNIVIIFTNVLVVCISAVLAFVFIQYYHLQVLVFKSSWLQPLGLLRPGHLRRWFVQTLSWLHLPQYWPLLV